MNYKLRNLLFVLATTLALPSFADTDTQQKGKYESEFPSDEKTEEGFLTHYINEAIASGITAIDNDKVEYGSKVTDYVSAPKIGGYFIGKYSYSGQEGLKDGNNGFSQRYSRFYVDGTILHDFAYRIQIQAGNDKFHMKDCFVEWQRYPEMKIKVGQFKRAFGIENPMNPWDVGTGDNSQLTKKLTGMGDYVGAESASNGGRDQGLQVQGDLFPIGRDHHRLLHYQLMVANGQGINVSDANSQKDIIGGLQIQPVKGIFFGIMGWTGNYTSGDVTVRRERYLLFGKYEKDDWSFRTEYAHNTGHKVTDYDKNDNKWNGTGRSDAWYATLGIPFTPWLKTWLKYDAYRDQGTWQSMKSIYSIAPNIQLHKNLKFQVQYNLVNDRSLTKHNYSELWVETYVRF